MLNKIKLIRKYKTGGLYIVKANDSLWKIAQKAAIATMIKLAHSYKNTGHNYNKIIRLWNNNNSYLNRVIRGKNRFTIYE